MKKKQCTRKFNSINVKNPPKTRLKIEQKSKQNPKQQPQQITKIPEILRSLKDKTAILLSDPMRPKTTMSSRSRHSMTATPRTDANSATRDDGADVVSSAMAMTRAQRSQRPHEAQQR